MLIMDGKPLCADKLDLPRAIRANRVNSGVKKGVFNRLSLKNASNFMFK